MISKNSTVEQITEEEAALYDRQIRLWGIDSQKRLRQSRILLYGLSGLGVEVAKNVVLAGVKSLTLMDDAVVSKDDVATNFTLSHDDIGKGRAVSAMPVIQKLNPMVIVSAEITGLDDKDNAFYTDYDVVCTIGCSQELMIKVNSFCAESKIQFIAGDTFGFYGFAFFDFGTHEYFEETQNKGVKKSLESSNGDTSEPSTKIRKLDVKDVVAVKKVMNYVRLTDALTGKETGKKSPGLHDLIKVVWNFKDQNGHLPNNSMSEEKLDLLKKLVQKLVDEKNVSKPALQMENILCFTDGEFSPTCAIVGGIIGQEIIKGVSQKDAPLDNFFIFDGTEGSGYVERIYGNES